MSIGSSPLARGLRGPTRGSTAARGIIPARAGFTPSPWVPSRRVWDHPRSRGVYVMGPHERRSVAGSSPLARGLLLFFLFVWLCLGIIPARAGFTPCSSTVCVPLPDHPRSRGVYGCPVLGWFEQVGSSPLARGLLTARLGGGMRRRIIPARAGFTGGGKRALHVRTDHPRSRGVYGCGDTGDVSFVGSSPLARGLHSFAGAEEDRPRIIPARAGFTSWTSPTASASPDHPRSRGVYSPVPSGPETGPGSSPLARGLRAVDDGGAGPTGIIPARAGFTLFRYLCTR